MYEFISKVEVIYLTSLKKKKEKKKTHVHIYKCNDHYSIRHKFSLLCTIFFFKNINAMYKTLDSLRKTVHFYGGGIFL